MRLALFRISAFPSFVFDSKVGRRPSSGLLAPALVGLIRLDLGIPLSDAKDAFRIHLVIGPEF